MTPTTFFSSGLGTGLDGAGVGEIGWTTTLLTKIGLKTFGIYVKGT